MIIETTLTSEQYIRNPRNVDIELNSDSQVHIRLDPISLGIILRPTCTRVTQPVCDLSAVWWCVDVGDRFLEPCQPLEKRRETPLYCSIEWKYCLSRLCAVAQVNDQADEPALELLLRVWCFVKWTDKQVSHCRIIFRSRREKILSVAIIISSIGLWSSRRGSTRITFTSVVFVKGTG